MRRDEIASMLKAYGPATVVHTVRDLLEGRKLQNGAEYKLTPEQFSIKELWEGLVGPCESTLPSHRNTAVWVGEHVDASAFTAVTKLLLAAKLIDGYESLGGAIGMSLVSNMPSKRRIENVAGFTSSEGMKSLIEGQEYSDSSIGDKYVTTQALKKGRLISLSEEAIMEDQTGQLLMKASGIGEEARRDMEETIVNGVLDKDSNVYRPSGTATALYSTTNGNLMGDGGSIAGFTSAEALVDWTDLDKVENFHSQSIKDDRQVGAQKPILWNPGQVLVPRGLNGTALAIKNATTIESIVSNQRTSFNNPKAGQFDVFTSPYIAVSGIAGASADWYYGDFRKQFIWQEVWPLQVFRQADNSESAFFRDLAAIFKVRYLGGIAALDHKHVVKVKGA